MDDLIEAELAASLALDLTIAACLTLSFILHFGALGVEYQGAAMDGPRKLVTGG